MEVVRTGVERKVPTRDFILHPLRADKEAQDQLFRAAYNELHCQAARYLRHENPGLSLQTTDLIHEAYLRLIDQQKVEWQNRLHFFGIAAQVMRRILVDHGRSRQAAERGGSDIRLPLEEAIGCFGGTRPGLS
jgi:RNA polymerase sigma factor (TIGR02999 family)